MSEFAHKIGPYHYAHEADCVDKVFEGSDGGKRTFKVVLSTAFNAGGLIGSEMNGVAILDHDNRQRMVEQAPASYDRRRQRELFKKLVEADWPQFCSLVRAHARNPHCMPDINAAEPAYVYPIPEADDWQVMSVEQEGPEDDPYTYPAQKRVAIVKELISHANHCSDQYSMFRLAWNIKVYDVDTSGKTSEYPGDAQFDARWEQYLKDEGQSVWESAQEDALSSYVGGMYTVYPGEMQGKIHLEVEGRSGGWLVLDRIDGVGKLGWDSQQAMEEELMGYSAEDLAVLYKVVRNLDRDVTRQRAGAELAHQYAFIRSQQEEEWAQELEEEPAAPRP